MALDFDKYCLVDGSPTTVLPAPRHRSSGKPKYRNVTPSFSEQLEMDIGDYCSGSCRDGGSRGVSRDREGSEVVKRESVYQSSTEVRLFHRADASVGREKIELSGMLGVIDSLCSLDEESSRLEQNRAAVMFLSEESNVSGITPAPSPAPAPAAIEEKNLASSLQQSLSARFSFPRSPAKSECDSSRASSPKARLSPVRKMLVPFARSKSHRSPLSKAQGETLTGLAGIGRNDAVCRSLLGDLLDKPVVEYVQQNEEKESHNSALQRSPAHLHGLLEKGNKHGVPYFQFSVDSPEDVYLAKAWRVENASTYVYTFYLVPHRRKRSSSGWGSKECNRESFMVGRMHVSCQQCTEFKGSGQLNDSMVTEFVLQDSLHSRKSTPSASQDQTSSNVDTNHPELEIAAMVMQQPLEKRESLKLKSGDKKVDESPPNLLDTCRLRESEVSSCSSSPSTMHVVIPAGSHSFPTSGSGGPSPLLARWRSGGGCDCGGWDMACPLNIFTDKIAEGQPLIQNQSRADLFLQGTKENNTPAFSMRVIEDGKYAVDFHAQFSSLQAFSIGVAILHAAAEEKRSKQTDSPAEEEIGTVQDAAAEEEKCEANKLEELMPSFMINPPFSPIARV